MRQNMSMKMCTKATTQHGAERPKLQTTAGLKQLESPLSAGSDHSGTADHKLLSVQLSPQPTRDIMKLNFTTLSRCAGRYCINPHLYSIFKW